MRRHSYDSHLAAIIPLALALIIFFTLGLRFHVESNKAGGRAIVMAEPTLPLKTEPEITLIVPQKTRIDSSATEPSIEFDPTMDYWAEMANFLAVGDEASAKEAERLGRLKKEYLGTDEMIAYNDLLLISRIVDVEAGSKWLTEEHRRLVASVIWNRMHSPEFPDTTYDVVYQKNQYAVVGTEWFETLQPSQESIQSALYVLRNGSIAPASVVFQAEFRQGSGVYKTVEDAHFGTTYFCYSSYPEIYNEKINFTEGM